MALKILVVDDEPQFERLISQRFRRKIRAEEYQFEFALNGVEALEKLAQQEDIDVVLSDINMPQMDGLTLLGRLKDRLDRTKVIMVSAYGDMDNIRVAMNKGAYDFVVKPIKFEDLSATIEKAQQEIIRIKEARRAKAKLSLMEKELAAANTVQLSILPTDFKLLCANTNIDLFAKMLPAKGVGGDFYDCFRVDDDRLAIVIGDVSGKGMPAALFMAMCRTILKATGLSGASPEACLKQTNQLLCQDNREMMFITVFYGLLELSTGQLTYCCAGHNPPLLLQNGTAQYLEESKNIAVGIMPNTDYQSAHCTLATNDTLVLYTDGITEAEDASEAYFGESRLTQWSLEHSALHAEAFTTSLLDEVALFATGMPQADDTTLLVVKVK